MGHWRLHHDAATDVRRHTQPISYQDPVYLPLTRDSISPSAARSSVFTELHSCHQLPLSDSELVTDIMTTSVDTTKLKNKRTSASIHDLIPNTDLATENNIDNIGHRHKIQSTKGNKTENLDESSSSGRKIFDGQQMETESSGGRLSNPLPPPRDVVHVTTVAPLGLHSLLPSDSHTRPLVTISLHSLLPSLGGSHQPRLRLWNPGMGVNSGVNDGEKTREIDEIGEQSSSAGNSERAAVCNFVGLYEELTNTVMLADPVTGEVLRVNTDNFMDRMTLPIRQLAQQEVNNRSVASQNRLLVYKIGHSSLTVVDPQQGKLHKLDLDMNVQSATADNCGGWIVTDTEDNKWVLDTNLDTVTPFEMEETAQNIDAFGNISDEGVNSAMGDESLPVTSHETSNDDMTSTNSVVLGTDKSHATILYGYNKNNKTNTDSGKNSASSSSSGQLYSWPRMVKKLSKKDKEYKMYYKQQQARVRSPPSEGKESVVIPSTGQIIRAVNEIPNNAPMAVHAIPAIGYLEITDPANRSLSWIPVPPPKDDKSQFWYWSVGSHAPKLLLSGGGSGGAATVDRGGGVRVWHVGGEALAQSKGEWESMVGEGEDDTGRLELKKSWGDMSLSNPKHGKIDAKNEPHVGGNQWAGGTGGRDTAGLGGVGGPYRLDAGHDVHQVSDDVKKAVPPEVSEAARKMAKAAHRKRLEEIKMRPHHYEEYAKFSESVTSQVTQLRALVTSLTAKAGERWWVSRRPDGDLDDAALVDGLAGEVNVYRQRRDVPPEAGQPQTKPKRLRLLLDASGSMYRFNGHDNRLQRSLEAALMLMLAAQGHEARLKYDIYAHSGEDHSVRLSDASRPPADDKRRMDILRTVLTHSQFCISGDTTLQATSHACRALAKEAEDADQSFVVLLSDANLDRYGISPARLATAMTSSDAQGVQCYAVFIGSLGHQARVLAQALPPGRSYVCLDTSELPRIMGHIFAHAMTQ